MKVIRFWPVVSLILAASPCPCAQAKPEAPLDFCQVLDNLRDYKGKNIVIRGILLATEEGTYLTGIQCPKPLVTNGHLWRNPPFIWLVPAPTGATSSTEANREERVKAALAAEVLGRYAREPDPKVDVWVTVMGRLETRDQFEIVLRGDGKRVPFGYGHLNACPAELLYWRMQDVKTTPKPASPK